MKRAALALIRAYQRHISPGMPASCRYYPSCSEYSAQAIDHYGVPIGIVKTIWRVVRCNPLSAGGYDPPHGSGPYQELPSTAHNLSADAANCESASRP